MHPAHFSREIIVAQRRANPFEFVGDDAHANTRTTDQDGAIHQPFRDRLRGFGSEIGIVADRILSLTLKPRWSLATAIFMGSRLRLEWDDSSLRPILAPTGLEDCRFNRDSIV